MAELVQPPAASPLTSPRNAGAAAPTSGGAAVDMLELRHWQPVLERFSAATGLGVAWLDHEGAEQFACHGDSPLVQWLAQAAAPHLRHEVSVLLGASASSRGAEPSVPPMSSTASTACLVPAVAEGRVFELLRVRVLPVEIEGRCAFIAFGYALSRFGSSHDAARLSRTLSLRERQQHQVQHALRATHPVSDARFEVYAQLLDTLVTARLRDLAAFAELAQHERARELLVAHVSHELRTPLMSSALRLELLLSSELNDPVELRRQLGLLRNSVADEAELVEDLIEIARMRTGQMAVELAPTRLVALVERSIETISPRAQRKQISIEFSTAAEADPLDDEIRADTSRLHQVFTNLLTNAVKFSPTGGRIQVRLRMQSSWVEVEVSDDGCGIQPELLARVFDTFAQAEPGSHKGLGLGLAVARQLVSLHGGEISAHSEGSGLGATFRVRLPRGQSGAATHS